MRTEKKKPEGGEEVAEKGKLFLAREDMQPARAHGELSINERARTLQDQEKVKEKRKRKIQDQIGFGVLA
jgi:hypothetical protein